MEIIGINMIGEESSNYLISQSSNVLTWVQDTSTANVWKGWQIEYRDILILDSFNRVVARDNLTKHDLNNAQNYEALRKAFIAVATPADTDHDGLPDDWEFAWFGNLDATAEGDPDADGFTNFEEFAFSSSPVNAAERPRISPVLSKANGKPALAAVFRRFSGGAVDFVAETSSDLLTWTSEPSALLRGTIANLHDGTGGAQARHQQTSVAGAAPAGFIRIRPVRMLSN